MRLLIDEFEAGELLASLVDKSLVAFDEALGRYRLLESVRQYSRDRLFESGEGEAWRDRHMAHFLALAEEVEPQLTGADQQAWLDRLEAEHDNLRVALEWSSDDPKSGMACLQLAGSLFQFWRVRGYFSEGRDLLSRALACRSDEDPVGRAKALTAAGNLAYLQSDYSAAQRHFDESLEIRQSLGDQAGIATILNHLGILSTAQGDFGRAEGQFRESLAIRRELEDADSIAGSLNSLGNLFYTQGHFGPAQTCLEEALSLRRLQGNQRGLADTLNNLGAVRSDLDDTARALTLHEESLAIRLKLGDRWGIAASLNNLGCAAGKVGDFSRARSFYGECLMIRRELGAWRGVAYALEGFAELEAMTNAPGRAARLGGAAQRLREEIGAPITPANRTMFENAMATARAAMADDPAFDAAWAEGQTMTSDQAIELAINEEVG